MALTKVTGSVIENNITVGILSVTSLNSAGIITASSFSGNATSATYATNAGISTNVIGGIGSLSQLQVTGISTFTNGPLLIGSGTSTGTASQLLQVTGGAYISGNIGIGTTNPSARLSVGSGSFTDANVPVQISSQSASGLVYYGANNNGTYGALFGYDRNAYGGGVIRVVGATDTISFVVNNTTRVATIDSSGNIGIGVTSSTWSVGKAIEVGQLGNALFGATASQLNLMQNSTYNANFKYVNSAAASYYQQLSGQHIWYNAPVGTAGSNITFNQAMTLDINGNLGIIGNITSGSSGKNGNVIVARSSDGAAVGQFYFDGTNVSINDGLAAGLVFKVGTSEKARLDASGNLGVGITNPAYKLEVNGSFAATTKSFIIPHPTKENYKLRHGSLEGPENGVYVRGRTTANIIELPEYWTGLIDENSITVNLTPIGDRHIWIEEINNNKIHINSNSTVDCFYTVFAERKDVEKLVVEIPEN